jgi:hypothetical protein
MRDLEGALRELGRSLPHPELRSQSTAVVSRLEVGRRPRRRLLPILAFAVAVAAALVAASLAFPGLRSAIERWFGFAGERIVVVDKLPRLPKPVNLRLGVGNPMRLSVAQRRLPYPAPVPRLAGLEPPAGVYLRQISTKHGPVFRLSLLWGKPHAYRLLFSATARTPAFNRARGHLARKRLGADLRVKPYSWTSVDGGRALWIAARHEYLFTMGSADLAFLARPADHVLLWESNQFAFRLEGALSLTQAVALASSVR